MFDQHVPFETLKSQFENNNSFTAVELFRGKIKSEFRFHHPSGAPAVTPPVSQLKKWAEHAYRRAPRGQKYVYQCTYTTEERGKEIYESLVKLTAYYPHSTAVHVETRSKDRFDSVFSVSLGIIEDFGTEYGTWHLSHLVQFKMMFDGVDRLFDLDPEYTTTSYR